MSTVCGIGQTENSSRTALSGPKPPSIDTCRRCGAALRTGHSLQTRILRTHGLTVCGRSCLCLFQNERLLCTLCNSSRNDNGEEQPFAAGYNPAACSIQMGSRGSQSACCDCYSITNLLSREGAAASHHHAPKSQQPTGHSAAANTHHLWRI